MAGLGQPTRLSTALLLSVVLAGCAPAGSSQPGGPAGGEPARPKILTLGATREPSDLGSFTATSGIRGASTATMIAHAGLTATDERETRVPELAVELPSAEKGTWRVNPDGTMDVTWKLRPNVKWQDGAPFTSADLLFSLQAYMDRDLPTRTPPRFVQSGAAPDLLTLALHWSQIDVGGDAGFGSPMPRHLIEDLYQTDKEAFVNSRYFTTEFVGLGPYRLVNWELGSFMQFERFDDHFRGRPPLDRVILQFVPDANTLLANVLSASIDIALPPTVGFDTMADVVQRWQGTGNVATAESSNRFRLMGPQQRAEYARPRFGTTVREVRQALYHAIDRKTMADVLTNGLAPVADSTIPPDYWFRSEVERAIPQYPFDVAQAQRLLAQVGWARGPDGALVHNQTGERFELLLGLAAAGGASGGRDIEANILRDNWKALGIDTSIEIAPPGVDTREWDSTVSGLSLTGNLGAQIGWGDRVDSRRVASPANRWAYDNKTGYGNPRLDPLLDSLRMTIDRTQQVALHREIVQIMMGDVALMPLYWEYVPIFWLRGVTGPIGARTGYRFFEWDKAE